MKRHLANLRRKHRELDDKISSAAYRSQNVQHLKTMRLRLKDRIRALQRGQREMAA